MQAKWMLAVGAAAMLATGAVQAAAQQVIPPEGSVSGRLDSRDPVSSTGGRFERWRIDAQPGELVVLNMTSSEIDSVVQIGRTGPGGQFYELGADDDGGGYPNALLQFQATEGGQYEVRATSFYEDQGGGYTLSRSSRVVSAPAQPGVATPPLDVGGYIDLDDGLDSDGRYFEAWRVRIDNQQVVEIRQEAADLDTFVMLGVIGPQGEWVPLLHDDDSGGGLNSRIIFQSVADDVFEIRASTYSPGATGAYRLTVHDISATSDGGLPLGYRVDGWLSEGDNGDGEGRFIEYRTFYATAGQTVTATVRSSEFDAYLGIGEWSNGAYHEMWSDDDSGNGETGFDAQSIFVAPFTGLYTARVTSYSPGEIGYFTFEVAGD